MGAAKNGEMVTTLIVKSQSVKTDQPCKTGTLLLRQPNWTLSNTWSILSLTRSSPKNIHSNSLRSLRNLSSRENSKQFKAALSHSPHELAPLCLNTRSDVTIPSATQNFSSLYSKEQNKDLRLEQSYVIFFSLILRFSLSFFFLSYLLLFFTETSQFGNSFSWGHLFLENLTSRNQFCYLVGKG